MTTDRPHPWKTHQLVLELPLPPSPNTRPTHHMELARWRSRTKRAAWCTACGQHLPSRHPPELVEVGAVFYLPQLRDQDNLVASLKHVLDALRLQRTTQERIWRQGVHELKGFLVDDSPDHMQLGIITQVKQPDPKRHGLRLVLTDLEAT